MRGVTKSGEGQQGLRVNGYLQILLSEVWCVIWSLEFGITICTDGSKVWKTEVAGECFAYVTCEVHSVTCQV